MPEIDDELKRSTDRITKVLARKTPSFQDIAESAKQEMFFGQPSGNVLSALRAGRLKEEQAVFDVLSSRKKMKQVDRQLELDEENNALNAAKYILDKAKFGADQGARAESNFLAAVKPYETHTSPGDYAKIVQETLRKGHEFEQQVGEPALRQIIGWAAEAAQRLGVKRYEKPTLELKEVYDPDSPTKSRYVTEEQAIGKPGIPRGIKLKQTGEGFEFSMGPDLEGGTKKDLEEKIVGINDGLFRVASIFSEFKPEYQELSTRWGMWMRSIKERGKGIPGVDEITDMLGATDKEALADYTRFRKRALKLVNEEIRRQTGATMSKEEAKRIQGSMPDVGAGLIPGESPTEFHTALRDVYAELKLAAARYHYAMDRGLNPLTDLTLSQMESIMIQREQELYQEEQGAQEPERTERVRQRLIEEFGL